MELIVAYDYARDSERTNREIEKEEIQKYRNLQ